MDDRHHDLISPHRSRVLGWPLKGLEAIATMRGNGVMLWVIHTDGAMPMTDLVCSGSLSGTYGQMALFGKVFAVKYEPSAPSMGIWKTRRQEWRRSTPMLTADTLRWYQRTKAGHAQRAACLAMALAHGLRRSEQEERFICMAALLHEIGKLSIPAAILNKPGPLTKLEWAIMRLHPEIGYQMLIGAGGVYTHVAPLVLTHHERWDGLGYPFGLAGKAIPLGARILAVADAYDAMTEQRPYRLPRTTAEASAEVRRCAGSRYDPLVVEALAYRCFSDGPDDSLWKKFLL
jgi:HD-GYP domain-containing protein (c-di-GMP phosphodiesterase class II)